MDTPKQATDHLYWARTASTGAAPPPKKISAEQAKQMETAAAGGSAWNKSGNTWEEKRLNQWAHELLKETLLGGASYELPGAAGALPPLPKAEAAAYGEGEQRLQVRVLSVESVTGDCTYVLSRGKQRVVFELQLKLQLELEVRVGGELKQILTGKVTLPEIANDDLDEAKLPGGSKMLCDQDGWKPYFEGASKTVWACVKGALTALVEQAKQKCA